MTAVKLMMETAIDNGVDVFNIENLCIIHSTSLAQSSMKFCSQINLHPPPVPSTLGNDTAPCSLKPKCWIGGPSVH